MHDYHATKLATAHLRELRAEADRSRLARAGSGTARRGPDRPWHGLRSALTAAFGRPASAGLDGLGSPPGSHR